MIVDPRIEEHLRRVQPIDDPVLAEMQASGEARDFPIIGPLVGRLCGLLATAVGARLVFEMGSGFGYSTAWFAKAVGAGGSVVHTDGDPELSQEARQWMARLGLQERVRFLVGDALDLLGREEGLFDVVFIDVDKGDYPRAWRLARERVRPGGLVLIDNALWQGKVADPGRGDEWTEAVRETNRLALGDPGFTATVLPLRDGLLVALRHPA